MILDNVRKIFVLGDLHLGVRNNSLEWSEIQYDYLVNFFLKKVDEEGFDPATDILVQVGDWNHVRESTNTRIYKLSVKIAEAFTKKFKKGVYVILGNHDVYYKDRTDTHSLEGFDRIFENFHIFDKPAQLKMGSHNFLMLPWIENLENLKEAIAKNSASDYVFCHTDFKGFNLNKVTKLEHGLEPNDIKGFKRIYSGHIHIRQEKGNVLYVGTPFEMDRGDRGNEKGFYVLDLSENKIKEKFVPNTLSPKHLKFEVTDLLDVNLADLGKIFKNNFVDIAIESSFSQRFSISRFTELIKNLGHRRVEFSSYSLEQIKSRSQVELDSNYEYNIFTVLDEKLLEMNLPEYQNSQITDKFKEIYDSLRNTKHYDQ
jgi:hypothetical protein